jgi:hypothetical protein
MELNNLDKKDLCCLAKNIGIKGARFWDKWDIISLIKLNYKIYRTIDNRGNPFEVYIDDYHITVFPFRMVWEDILYYEYDKPVLKLKNYDKLWLGEGNTEDWLEHYTFRDGAAILIRKDNTYYFIGVEVYSFKIDNDNILRFGCPIESSWIVSPYAIGENFTYDLSLYNHYIISNKDRENIEPLLQAHNMTRKVKLKVKILHSM